MHKVIVLPFIERMGIMGQQEFNEVNQWEMQSLDSKEEILQASGIARG